MIVYYTLLGRLPVPCADLAAWHHRLGSDDWNVDRTDVGCLSVSTVFLGLDHSWGDGPPQMFETMIFNDGEPEDYQTRCATWDEAEKMHALAVFIVTARIAAADLMVGNAVGILGPKCGIPEDPAGTGQR